MAVSGLRAHITFTI